MVKTEKMMDIITIVKTPLSPVLRHNILCGPAKMPFYPII
jgi:hypothetical protein